AWATTGSCSPESHESWKAWKPVSSWFMTPGIGEGSIQPEGARCLFLTLTAVQAEPLHLQQLQHLVHDHRRPEDGLQDAHQAAREARRVLEVVEQRPEKREP